MGGEVQRAILDIIVQCEHDCKEQQRKRQGHRGRSQVSCHSLFWLFLNPIRSAAEDRGAHYHISIFGCEGRFLTLKSCEEYARSECAAPVREAFPLTLRCACRQASSTLLTACSSKRPIAGAGNASLTAAAQSLHVPFHCELFEKPLPLPSNWKFGEELPSPNFGEGITNAAQIFSRFAAN